MENVGIDKDTELNIEIDARYKACQSFYERWEQEAKEDYAFGLGDQWRIEDRQKLGEVGRPCLTFNRIKPIIGLVSGYQRENSAKIKVSPEGSEDKIFSEVMDKVLGFIDKNTHLTYRLGYMFDDGLYCGKGWLEASITYDKDPILGELNFKQLTPYQVKVDPNCLDYDINDSAEYVFKIVRLSKEKLKYLYPKKKKLIDGFVKDNDSQTENGSGVMIEGDRDDYGNNPNKTTVVQKSYQGVEDSEFEKDQKFTLKEYWRLKTVTKYYVVEKETGEPQKFDTKEEAQAFAITQNTNAMEGMPGQMPMQPTGKEIKVIEREVNEMWVAARCCGFILQDEKSPFEPHYSGFPLFRYMADWTPNADSELLRVQGMVRQLKDPQREKNKSKSQNLHILNTQANSGWIADDNAMSEEDFKDLENMGSIPGIVIRKRTGTEVREILPKGPNAGHLQREQQADEEFKQISAINPDLMGMQEGTASGKAIGLRIKQAIMSLIRLFSNFRYTKECIGKFELQMMPLLLDSKKLMKILGPQYLQLNQLDEGSLMAMLTMIKDNKYDILVTESDHNSTVRFETFNQLVELVKSGIPIPPDLIIDYMDVPNSTEIKEKILIQQQQQQQMQMMESLGKSGGQPAPSKAG